MAEMIRVRGAREHNLRDVDLDTTATPPTFPGWTATGSELVPFLSGVDFRVTTYARLAGT